MQQLDEGAAAALAGGDVEDVAEARSVEPVAAADVGSAEQAAADAEALAVQLEHEALANPEADHSAVLAAAEASRFARLRASLVRRRAERSQQAQRILALEEVGKQADALAAEFGAGLAAAFQMIAVGAEGARLLASQHDGQVRALAGRAKELGAEPAAPSGPRASSAHVAAGPHSITHAAVRVATIGDRITEALQLALAGNAGKAADLTASVVRLPQAHRAAAYLRSHTGLVVPLDGAPSESQRYQLAQGTLVRLTPEETDRYLKGELE